MSEANKKYDKQHFRNHFYYKPTICKTPQINVERHSLECILSLKVLPHHIWDRVPPSQNGLQLLSTQFLNSSPGSYQHQQMEQVASQALKIKWIELYDYF